MTTDPPWEFGPTDDGFDDEVETSAEEDAMSVVEAPERATGVRDPGRREVDIGAPDNKAPLALYADEEGASDDAPDHLLDLAEILEMQHYTPEREQDR